MLFITKDNFIFSKFYLIRILLTIKKSIHSNKMNGDKL